jgi:hypothetical protein
VVAIQSQRCQRKASLKVKLHVVCMFGVSMFVQTVRTKLSESDRKEGSARSGSGAAHVGAGSASKCEIAFELFSV